VTRCYDALQRLTTATRILGGAVNYSYSPSGNILSKSDYGSSYGYQANGCGPHAASSISVVAALGAGTLNYNCDANGNVVTGTGGSANALPVTTTFDASKQFVGHACNATFIAIGSANDGAFRLSNVLPAC